MDVSIFCFNEYADTKGKTTKAICGKFDIATDDGGLTVTGRDFFNDIGDGSRNGDPKRINKTVTLRLSLQDLRELFAAAAKSGLFAQERREPLNEVRSMLTNAIHVIDRASIATRGT